MSEESVLRCGFVAFIGRPNVGKSTLLNQLLGRKLSITSRKPQTTRHRIMGVRTAGARQAIYVDTPGLHQKEAHALNRYMNKVVHFVAKDVDVIVFVVDSLQWTPEDNLVIALLAEVKVPVILVINKIDKILDKERLLPHLAELSEKYAFADIVPISARRGVQVDVLQEKIYDFLPANPHFYPEDQWTDCTPRFIVSEYIREQLTRLLGAELPYAITIAIDEFFMKNKTQHVSATIWIERASQKPIVVGTQGENLKKVGIGARLAMEKLLGHHVNLRLWVKVKEGWSDDVRALTSLGYLDLK
jgi:GTP-binding protein Era